MAQSFQFRWRLPGRLSDYLIVHSLDASEEEASRQIPAIFVIPLLDAWLSSAFVRILDELYESLGGCRPLGLTGLDHEGYKQRLKKCLTDAFHRGELVALEVGRTQLDRAILATPNVEPPAVNGSQQPRSGTLSVQVTDSVTSRGISGATVALSGPSSANLTTDNRGWATFATLAPGAYTIRATHSQYQADSSSGTVIAGTSRTATLQLQGIASIEVLDAAGNVVNFVQIGLWDGAFDATHTPFNEEQEANNFVGADSRRFFFRVRDPSASQRTSIQWWAVFANGADFTDTPSSRQLTLLETAPGSGIFLSKAVMLVYDHDDVQTPTHSGLPAGLPDTGVRNFGQSNHRLRRVDMFGGVIGAYAPAGGRPSVKTGQVPVFTGGPVARRNIPLQIFVLRVAVGGAGVIPTAAGSDVWRRDLRVLREVYGRLGMWVWTVVAPGVPAANIVTDGRDSLVLIDPPAGANPANISFADEIAICNAITSQPDTLRIIYVGGLSSGNGGESFADVNTAPRDAVLQGAGFIIFGTGPYAAAHEAGHCLTNKAVATSSGHFAPPTAAGSRLSNTQNHMKREFLGAEGMGAPKRLWDANDADGLNQFTAIRGSRYSRA